MAGCITCWRAATSATERAGDASSATAWVGPGSPAVARPDRTGRLKKRDKVLERLGRLKSRYPKGCPFVTITVASRGRPQVSWSWHVAKFKAALAADGAVPAA